MESYKKWKKAVFIGDIREEQMLSFLTEKGIFPNECKICHVKARDTYESKNPNFHDGHGNEWQAVADGLNPDAPCIVVYYVDEI